ncbi:MAG: phage portal protein, partial [Chloroflexi bacterium]
MGIATAIRKLFRASIEDPSTSLSDPDAWFMEWAGVDGTMPSVNQETALGVPAIAAAVRRRAQTIASLSVGVYENTSAGPERRETHPVDYIVGNSPHPIYSAFQLWQAAVVNLDVTGNGYIEIKRNGRGRPVGLEIIPSNKFVDIRKEVTSGEYFYFFQSDTADMKVLHVDDVIHLKGLSYNAIKGLNPTKIHKDAIGAGLANDAYSASFYASGGHIQYALEAPQEFSPKA